MSMPKGTRAGGVRSVEDIRLRCYCDQDTGCWLWRGASFRRHGRPAEPRVWMADERRTESLPRAVWTLAGKPLPDGHTVWRRCLNSECGNPKHLMAGTKAAWGAWRAAKGDLRGRPERVAMNRRLRIERGDAVLTMELALWIRESQQTGRAIAQALGLRESTVSRARRGQTWSPPPVASVFGWAMAQGATSAEAAGA